MRRETERGYQTAVKDVVGAAVVFGLTAYGAGVVGQAMWQTADLMAVNEAKRIQDTIQANPEGYKIVPLNHAKILVIFDKEAEDIEKITSKALNEMTQDGLHYVHKVVQTSSETTSSRLVYLIPR